MAFFDFLSFSLNRAFLLSGSTFHECWHEKHSSSLAECQNCCRLCTVWRFGVFAFFRSWKIREFYEASLARAASWSRKRLSDKAERSHNFFWIWRKSSPTYTLRSLMPELRLCIWRSSFRHKRYSPCKYLSKNYIEVLPRRGLSLFRVIGIDKWIFGIDWQLNTLHRSIPLSIFILETSVTHDSHHPVPREVLRWISPDAGYCLFRTSLVFWGLNVEHQLPFYSFPPSVSTSQNFRSNPLD